MSHDLAAPAVILKRTAEKEEVRFRGGGFMPVPRPIHSWLAFAAILLFWQAVTVVGWVNPVFLPSPAGIVGALWSLCLSGELWHHLSASLLRMTAGWTLGTAVGVAAGIAIGLSSSSRAVFVPLVSAVYPVPKIALLPLLILWMGIGEAPKVATISAGVFFPTVIATFSGVDGVPRNLIRMGQSFDLPVSAIISKIILPAALPSILAGFRISISTAVLLLVAAEMIGAQFGIGTFVLTAGNLMQTDDLMAGVFVLSLLGLGLGAVLSLAEKTFINWR